MSEPKRIQRKRSKGWRMPEGAVYVGRPTRFGNPWSLKGYFSAGYRGTTLEAAEACVENYRAWMTRTVSTWTGTTIEGPVKTLGQPMVHFQPPDVSGLRGKNLACWCQIDQPCHADVLIQLANADLGTDTIAQRIDGSSAAIKGI